MPKLSLAERLERAAQRRAKVDEQEARLRLIERKQRSRVLITLGGIVDRAGVSQLSETALYGALLIIAEQARDPEVVRKWEEIGRGLLVAESEERVVAIARFGHRLAEDHTAKLRATGFRWNRLLGQWEGRVVFDAASELVSLLGGSLATIDQNNGTVAPRQELGGMSSAPSHLAHPSSG